MRTTKAGTGSLVALALTALLAGGAAADPGQERGTENKGGLETKEAKPTGKAGAQTGAKKQGGGAGGEVKQGGDVQRGGAKPADAEVKKRGHGKMELNREEIREFMRRLVHEDNLHHKNLASIKRLSQLAKEQDDKKRLAELETLHREELARHERVVVRLKRVVGDENFRRGRERIREAVLHRQQGKKETHGGERGHGEGERGGEHGKERGHGSEQRGDAKEHEAKRRGG